MRDRSHREFTEDDVRKIADTYHHWRTQGGKKYKDVKGFCKSATLTDVQKHNFVLTPGRYVGIQDEIDDGIPFDTKIKRLTAELAEQMAEEIKLNKAIKKNLKGLGYDV